MTEGIVGLLWAVGAYVFGWVMFVLVFNVPGAT